MFDDDTPSRSPNPADESQSLEHESDSTQPGESNEPSNDAGQQPGETDLLAAVRRAAGWRVSPRQLAAAMDATSGIEGEPSPERLAELIDAMRGDRSQRQSRHAELWRALGAELAVRGQPSDPAAQRAFIGEARARAGHWAGDGLLLRIALQVAASGVTDEPEAEPFEPIEPRQVALVARGLRRRFGRRLDQLDLRDDDGPFADALMETVEQVRERLNEPAEEGQGQGQEQEHSTRREPGRTAGPGGRHDRSRFRPRSGADRFRGPRKRTHRRAKPAGVSRKPRKKR